MTSSGNRIVPEPLRKLRGLSVPGSSTIFRFLLGCGLVFVCILVGLMVAVLPYFFVIAVAAVPIFFLLVAWRLEYGVLAVLALVSGIVHEAFLPSISFLRAGDLAFFAVGAITLASGRKLSKGFQRSEVKLWLVFAAFLLLVPVSVTYAIFFQQVLPKDALGEARQLMYLLMFPLTVAVLNTKERVRRFIAGVLVLGVLFSLGQILQSVFNVPIFGSIGIVSIVQPLNLRSNDVTLSRTGGVNIILFGLFMVTGRFVIKKIRTVNFLFLSALLTVGILLTFGRTTWGATLLGMAVVVYLLGLRGSWPMLIWSMVGASLTLGLLIAVKPTMLDALVTRATSVETEIASGTSVGWRYYEAGEVVPQIIANPILGIGLGAAYRRPNAGDLQPENVRYIHNGYLYISSKLGVPALVLLLWYILAVLGWSWQAAQRDQNPDFRDTHAAICAAIIGILLASIAEPHLMTGLSLACIGVLAAITVILKRYAYLPEFNEARTALFRRVPARTG